VHTHRLTHTHTHTHTHAHIQVLPSLHLLSPFNCANGVWGTVLALLVVQVLIVVGTLIVGINENHNEL
jgi:hypothetical protein